jgi:uncharacterized protein YndB with AHSA1/START domain
VRSARQGSVRTHIDASPVKVYSVLADLDRMGEWSPECYKVAWLNGASSPATPGSRFKGWNRYGFLRWSMTCEVKAAEPGRELAFSTVRGDRELVTWSYRLEPADGGGTDLTESFQCHWLPLSAVIAEDFLMPDRDRRREASMQATLGRIKAAAEC